MSRSKELLNNTLLFSIGQFGSKLFVLILIPIYTYSLTTEQLGTADLLQNTMNLLLPIFTLGIAEATMRFTIQENLPKTAVLTAAIKISILGFFTLLIFSPLIRMIDIFGIYSYYLPFMFIATALNSVFSYFCRGIDKIKLYISSSIISAALLFILNIILVVWFRFGIHGYLISYIFANVIPVVFLTVFGDLVKYIKFDSLEKQVSQKMLKYSLPLVPNSLSWWVTMLSDRYILVGFWGVEVNGLYSIATRIPSAMGVIISVFIQAWQLSAIREFSNNKNSQFFSKVYKKYSALTFIIGTMIILFSQLIGRLMFLNEFYHAWKYIPILMVAATVSNIQKYFGAIYSASLKTNRIFMTSLLGAIVNIILNFLFIPKHGAYGAALATLVSYFVVLLYRVLDTRKIVNMDINLKKDIGIILILLLQAYLVINNNLYAWITSVFLTTVIFAVCYRDIKDIVSFFVRYIKDFFVKS